MSSPIAARYYNGEHLTAKDVTVAIVPDGGGLHLAGEGWEKNVPLTEVRASSRLGRVPRFLQLPDGAHLAVPPDDALDAVLDEATAPSWYARLLHTLESHAKVATLSLFLIVGLLIGGIWLGLPALARNAALAVPTELEKQAGRAAYSTFDYQVGGDTELNPTEMRHAGDVFKRMVKAAGMEALEPVLVPRNLNVPNAFAFPGGIIVISDSLVRLALAEPQGEDLLAAVYAHELAHVRRRHGLQLVLRSSAALATVATITGDLSTLTAFSTTLPFLLIQRGYSREFESEADLDATALLRTAGIDPTAMGRALELLEKRRPEGDGPDFTYLSTHPATAERIQKLKTAP